MSIPRPLAVDGVVSNDARERVLTVRLHDDVRGYPAMLWSQGHRAQVRDLETGSRGTAPTVYASGAGRRQVAHGVPGDGGTMRFRFPPGNKAYSELVGTPDLRAIVTVDRESGHIMGVRFTGRRRVAA